MERNLKAFLYAKAGVDIPKENRAISTLVAKLTYKRKGPGAPIGHYAGLIDFKNFFVYFLEE